MKSSGSLIVIQTTNNSRTRLRWRARVFPSTRAERSERLGTDGPFRRTTREVDAENEALGRRINDCTHSSTSINDTKVNELKYDKR